MEKIKEYFKRFARQRGVQMADALAEEMRRVVGVQAPTRRTRSGKVVAATKAIPFAPPRRVTGKLQKSITVRRTIFGATVTVHQPYGVPLETLTHWYGWPHLYVARAKANLGIRGGTY